MYPLRRDQNLYPFPPNPLCPRTLIPSHSRSTCCPSPKQKMKVKLKNRFEQYSFYEKRPKRRNIPRHARLQAHTSSIAFHGRIARKHMASNSCLHTLGHSKAHRSQQTSGLTVRTSQAATKKKQNKNKKGNLSTPHSHSHMRGRICPQMIPTIYPWKKHLLSKKEFWGYCLSRL